VEVAVAPKRNPVDPFPGLRDRLAREYGELVPDDEIDLVAREVLDDLSAARIREFVPVFAWRRARARLRR
jgi:hypothetical protein